jgi:alpha-beta hydrolase superfamily lysophospholipase
VLRAPPKLQFKPDELYSVPTRDGSSIALGRYHPRGETRFSHPVILGHSLATNRFNLDFDETYSLARFLARRGFETWVLELRGHGLAGSAVGSSFDCEAMFDVEAALKTVVSTGPKKVCWVGHSRGGLLAYAHLARFPSAPIAAIAAIASPVAFSLAPLAQTLVQLVSPMLQLPVWPLAFGARLAAPFGLPPKPVGPFLLNKSNVERRVIHQSLRDVVCDVPGGVGRQFARWVGTGAFDGEDGFDYRNNMQHLTVPILTLTGAADALVPLDAARVAHLTSGPVESRVLGLEHGFSADYGHGDLVLGRRAPTEVFPLIFDFFLRHTKAPDG